MSLVAPIDYKHAAPAEISKHLRDLVAELTVETTDGVLVQFLLACSMGGQEVLRDDELFALLTVKISALADQLAVQPVAERLLEPETYRQSAASLLKQRARLLAATAH